MRTDVSARALRRIISKFRSLDVTNVRMTHEEMPYLLSLVPQSFLAFQFQEGIPIPEVLKANQALGLGLNDHLLCHRDPNRWATLIWWVCPSEELEVPPIRYLRDRTQPLSRLVECAQHAVR